jgi:hypothetical protein
LPQNARPYREAGEQKQAQSWRWHTQRVNQSSRWDNRARRRALAGKLGQFLPEEQMRRGSELEARTRRLNRRTATGRRRDWAARKAREHMLACSAGHASPTSPHQRSSSPFTGKGQADVLKIELAQKTALSQPRPRIARLVTEKRSSR